ncbi:MAG: cysteine hydrolase family protein [Acutalibacteraceae bacterium]
MKLLAVIDMQNDFVTGSLKNDEAVKIIPAVINKLSGVDENETVVVFTKDTHTPDYLNTQEGKNLPFVHCVKGTDGWDIIPELKTYAENKRIFEKPSFGSEELADYAKDAQFSEIELIGVCTDICVISNAMLLKAALPEAEITVDSACCAGVTVESHNNALNAMKMCQIKII